MVRPLPTQLAALVSILKGAIATGGGRRDGDVRSRRLLVDAENDKPQQERQWGLRNNRVDQRGAVPANRSRKVQRLVGDWQLKQLRSADEDPCGRKKGRWPAGSTGPSAPDGGLRSKIPCRCALLRLPAMLEKIGAKALSSLLPRDAQMCAAKLDRRD